MHYIFLSIAFVWLVYNCCGLYRENKYHDTLEKETSLFGAWTATMVNFICGVIFLGTGLAVMVRIIF